MDKRTLAALRGSIQKWILILLGESEDRGTMNCPLCQEFLEQPDRPGCRACPVCDDTDDHHGCRHTPYEAWVDHHAETHWGVDGWRDGNRIQCPECVRLAELELAFLRSLCPEDV